MDHISPYTKLICDFSDNIHVYFSTELKHVSREYCRLFLKELKNLGIDALLIENANPFFVIIANEMKAFQVWEKFPVNQNDRFNGKMIKDLKWNDLREPDQNTDYTFQIWDIYGEYPNPHYDLFILNDKIYRSDLPIKHPTL